MQPKRPSHCNTTTLSYFGIFAQCIGGTIERSLKGETPHERVHIFSQESQRTLMIAKNKDPISNMVKPPMQPKRASHCNTTTLSYFGIFAQCIGGTIERSLKGETPDATHQDP